MQTVTLEFRTDDLVCLGAHPAEVLREVRGGRAPRDAAPRDRAGGSSSSRRAAAGPLRSERRAGAGVPADPARCTGSRASSSSSGARERATTSCSSASAIPDRLRSLLVARGRRDLPDGAVPSRRRETVVATFHGRGEGAPHACSKRLDREEFPFRVVRASSGRLVTDAEGRRRSPPCRRDVLARAWIARLLRGPAADHAHSARPHDRPSAPALGKMLRRAEGRLVARWLARERLVPDPEALADRAVRGSRKESGRVPGPRAREAPDGRRRTGPPDLPTIPVPVRATDGSRLLRPPAAEIDRARPAAGDARPDRAQDALPRRDVPRGATAERSRQPGGAHGERPRNDRPGLLGRGEGPLTYLFDGDVPDRGGGPDRPGPAGRRGPSAAFRRAGSGPVASRARAASAARVAERNSARSALDPLRGWRGRRRAPPARPPPATCSSISCIRRSARERRPLESHVAGPLGDEHDDAARPGRVPCGPAAGSCGSRPGSVRRRSRGRWRGCRAPPPRPRSRPGS